MIAAFSWNRGAFPVKAVDTTGAGDSFVGALLTKIVDDQSVLEVILTFCLVSI